MRFLSLLYYHGSRLKLPWSQRTQERFRSARQFDRLYALDRDPFAVSTSAYESKKARALLSLIGNESLRSVLDVGCGTGQLSKILSQRATTVVGIDFSKRAIDLARALFADARIRFEHQSIAAFSSNDRFDTVICSEVLYYLGEDELAESLGRMRRHAKPRASLFVTARADDDAVWKRLRDELPVVSFTTFADHRRPFSIGRYFLAGSEQS